MDSIDFKNICRLCANTIRDQERARNIFSYLRGKLQLQAKILIGVELKNQNDLPDRACERCHSELDLANKFRERCLFSQKYLLDMLKKERVKEVQYFNEIIKEETDSSGETSDLDSAEPHKLELIDENDFVEEIEAAEPVQIDNENFEVINEVVTIEATAEETTEVKLAEQQLQLLEQEERNPPKHRQNFFICEQCGQYFSQQYQYKEHLEYHAGKKNLKIIYPCNDCTQHFKSKAMLKQHQLKHAHERRHACTKCGERFADRGAKLRHEKAHENERPYPCLECKRTFSSAFELQKHLVKHKLAFKYRCEPCSRDFTKYYELYAHSQTLPHKHNAQHMQNEMDMLYADADEINESI